MFYLDTSYLVKCYLNEPGTSYVLNWIEGKTGLSCSLHGRLELWTTLCRHQREGRITKQEFQLVAASIQNDEDNAVWTWLNLSRDTISAACSTVETISRGSFLRSADALHLACASENGFKSVYSHDKIMLASAKHFGLKGIDVIEGI
ncbi:MAG: type II toxin-antitoxin system VapC family toxin [Spirochaetales bacterium]|jgi:predicted nucleic acid-binding protein|nr:type II toxin-antitoxin system VapC family toxin [Spirochaetales bacterium]